MEIGEWAKGNARVADCKTVWYGSSDEMTRKGLNESTTKKPKLWEKQHK